MKTEFTVEYLSNEERKKPKVLQQPMVARITIEGEIRLVDAISALIKTKYSVR